MLVVTDGSSTQYPGDAETRARKEQEAVKAAQELGVGDYVHLDLPDMRLDTLEHVEVNASSRSTSATMRRRSCTRFTRTSTATTGCSSTRSRSRRARPPAIPCDGFSPTRPRRARSGRPRRSTGSGPTGTSTSPERSSGSSRPSPTTRPSAASIRTRAASGRSARLRSSTARVRLRARGAIRVHAQPRAPVAPALARGGPRR